MRWKEIELREVLAFFIVSTIVFSICSAPPKCEAQSYPDPQIVSVDYPEAINLGEIAHIVVRGRNNGGESTESYLTTSFPSNPSYVGITSSDASLSEVYRPGDTVWGGYGQYQLTLQYPFAEAWEIPWSAGLQHHISMDIRPEETGTFTFYVKMTSRYGGGDIWFADPSVDGTESSIKDQQDEYVYGYEINVQPPHMDLVAEYLPHLVFDEEEHFYPTNFLYDDTDIANNPSNYDKDTWPNTVYVHTVQGTWDQKEYLVIEYWFYYARDDKLWGIEFPWIGPHDHDWESIYLFLEKESDGYVPSKIAYFKHEYLVGLSLKDYYNIYDWQQTSVIPAFEKREETHPIVHVAVDSHGSYERHLVEYGWPLYYAPSGDPPGIPYPEPVDGGREMGPSDFTTVFVSTPNPSWPSEKFGDVDAPWAKSRWNDPWYLLVPRPIKNSLSIVVRSPVDILVVDPQNRRVGYDSETGIVVNEIPEATYSGSGSEPQFITMLSPTLGVYSVHSFGTGTGSYTIIIESTTTNGTVVGTLTLNGTASQGKLDMYSVELTEDYAVIPEFPSFLILPLFLMVTLLAIVLHRRKHSI